MLRAILIFLQERRFIIDNAIGQQHNYITLEESEMDLVFSYVQIKNYAKLQMVGDGLARTLKIDDVDGDGTGLFRVQANQKGELERIASSNGTASKLHVNLELSEGGEFTLSETVTILGMFPDSLILNGILRGPTTLTLGEGRNMTVGSSARIVPYFLSSFSDQADVFSFQTFELAPGNCLIIILIYMLYIWLSKCIQI